MKTAGECLVIGLGNPERGDDGVGPLVAERLLGKAHSIIHTGDAFGLIEDWAGADFVFVVDAAALFSAPGCVHRIDALQEALPRALLAPSTHTFGLIDAIQLARALDVLPRRLVIFAIEGACFELGAGISPEVSAAADRAVRLIMEELRILDDAGDPIDA
jgi:hydrogenase maturation protease